MMKWIVDRAYASRFSEPVLADIVSKKIVSKETVVRKLDARRVSFLSLKFDSLPDVYLKAYSVPFTKIFRALVFPYGLKEWHVAAELLKRGVPTYTPIAIGFERVWGICRNVYFITEAIPGTMTLKEYIEEHSLKGDDTRLHYAKELIEQFADFVSGIRRAGVLHRDFHWGNVLVRIIPDGPARFYLIDLHNVTLKQSLSPREVLSNLALLNVSLHGNVPAREQINFLRIYLKNNFKKRGAFLRSRGIVEDETATLLLKKWIKRARRCLGQNKYFMKVDSNGFKGYVGRGQGENALAMLIDEPDGVFSKEGVVVLKDSRTTTSLLISSEGPGCGIYIKRYNVKGLFFYLKNLLRSARAKKVWYAANSMTARDVPTPCPLLYLEQRKFRVLLKSYFVTESITGARTLEDYVTEFFAGLSRRRKRALIRTVALSVRRMHARGIFHGDLKAKNILLQQNNGGAQKVFFVDLDAVRVKSKISFNAACRDVARLNCSFLNTAVVSKVDRLYFLKCYLGRVRRQYIKDAWGRITSFTERKLDKSGRAFTVDR